MLAAEHHLQRTTAHDAVGLVSGGTAQAHARGTDIPRLQRPIGQRVGQLQAQGGVIGAQRMSFLSTCRTDGVGEERGVVGLIIVVAVVAEELAQAGSLVIKILGAEGIARQQRALHQRRVDEVLHSRGEADIGKRVNTEERVHLHGVGNLRHLRVLLRHLLIADVAMQIAVCAQHLLGHLSTQGGIDLTHQHGRLAKDGAKPAAKLCLRVLCGIPYPKGIGERRAIIAAAQQSTGGSHGQCGLHLRLRVLSVLAVLIVGVDNLFQSHIHLVVVGNVLRGGAGCEKKEKRSAPTAHPQPLPKGGELG